MQNGEKTVAFLNKKITIMSAKLAEKDKEINRYREFLGRVTELLEQLDSEREG